MNDVARIRAELDQAYKAASDAQARIKALTSQLITASQQIHYNDSDRAYDIWAHDLDAR